MLRERGASGASRVGVESLSVVGGKKRAQSDVVASTAVGIGTDCCEIDHIITRHGGREASSTSDP